MMQLRFGFGHLVHVHHRPFWMFLVGVLLAACSRAAPTPSVVELATGTVSKHGMTLSVVAEPAVVAAGQPIEVEATITNDGREPLVVSGSGSGFVFFSVKRLEDGLTSGEPVTPGDCGEHIVPVGEPIVIPFAKSGAWSEDDAHADFLRTYFADSELTLPSGTWQIDVSTLGNVGEGCTGPLLDLEVALQVTVTNP
jgi:hypothetical protein